MAVVNVKEIYKEFGLAKKHFKKAIDLAKKNILVGEIHFSVAEKKVRTRKVPRSKSEISTPELEGKILTDLDKNGYMSKRQKRETADNA